MTFSLPQLGVGLGYRSPQLNDIIREKKHVDFVEVVSDQFIFSNAERMDEMLAVTDGLPLVPHSLALSVGTAASVDQSYLERNEAFVRRVNAPWFSDHLCFTKVPETDLGSLTPLWFTEEVADNVVRNIQTVQRAVPDRPFLVENITYYFPVPQSTMTEAEFITRILDRADCGLLLDLNNVYINSQNLGFDSYAFLDSLPLDRVVQIHIAGHEHTPGLILDTHASPVAGEVWDLLSYVVKRSPVKGVLLERDENYPPFSAIVEELEHARRILSSN